MKIKVNGININYELTGPKGAPLVMLSHSLACSLVMWQPQMAVLESAFRVLRFDTRGHGDSDAPPGAYSLEQLAADAVGLLDALKIKTVHFVGLSMGGMIGQCLALNYSDRLKSLALCDTAAIMPAETQPIWQQRIDAAGETGMAGQVDETLERWFRPEFLQLNPPEVDMIRRQILATPPAGYIGCCEAIRRLNYLERLAAIGLPTLIMVGEEDPGTPVAASEAMHACISGSKLVILPEARHLSNIEQAEAFNTALMDFLA
ncbi:MAG: 3-oxoadipate enol-lactonase [Deltaproteobacteria bacterium]|jgi:3-oxoadipate enol-lactonase|nr:3-oxoadipate enol-lactonase [Deltaproteobacteria bacterium]MBW2482694.1 3-oxoadipate enol-lactonase [Deltaproteobacteria bacterium]